MKEKNNYYNNLQCIWMASKVVDYKLCDRHFDCDNCYFDKSMRNIQHHVNSKDIEDEMTKAKRIIQNVINKIEYAEFNSQYAYFSNHLIAKNLFANTYYLGFSPVLIDLLDNFTLIEYSSRGEQISKDQKILKISGPWGELDITAPISFTSLGHITESQNTNERWFSLIEAPRSEFQANSVPISDYHRDIISITKELTQFHSSYPDVGVTLMDGGIEARYLCQVIGNNKYLNILKTLFHKNIKDMDNEKKR